MDDNTLLLNSFFDKYNNELYLVFKDVETGKKYVKTKEDPKIPVYLVKDNKKIPDYFMEYRNRDELRKTLVSYRFREWELARKLPGWETFTEDVRNDVIEKDRIYLDKRIFGGDININDRLIMDYLDSMGYEDSTGEMQYPDTPPIENIHLGFFDLEWDIKNSNTDEIFSKKHPIYLMTYIDAKTNECYTYYLKNEDYNKQDMLIEHTDDFVKDLKERMYNFFDSLEGKSKKEEEQIKSIIFDRLEDLKYNIKGFDSEKKMIKRFYKTIFLKKKPDFLYAFNTEADITQTELRAKALGINPKELFTHPEVGDYYWFNTRDNTFKPSEKRHNYDCASYTKIMDMMITYYSVRSFQSFTEYSLDATANRELGIGKLDYSHICQNIEDLPYKDFNIATQYNIIDVLSMVFIEDIIEDTETILTKRFITRTNYDRMFISMQKVMNVFYHFGERNGKILSNKINKYLLRLNKQDLEYLKEKDKRTYDIIMAIKEGGTIEGGLCTDPNLVEQDGHNLFEFLDNTKLHHTVIDADASSMYPNNIITGNISKSTLIGRVTFISGLIHNILNEYTDDEGRYVLKISEDEWDTIKSKKNNIDSFDRKYKAVEAIGYEEDMRGNLYIDIDKCLDDYSINMTQLLSLVKGNIIERDKFEAIKPEDIGRYTHKRYREVFQMFLKRVTSDVGERALLSMIQRDIIKIGNIFFGLPDLTKLEEYFYGYSPKRIEEKRDEKKRVIDLKSTAETKKLLTILSNIDNISLTNMDEQAGMYNTNGLFLLNNEKVNELSLHGRYVRYYLESKKPIGEYFEIDEKLYLNRQGEVFNHIYEEQTKPDIVPDLKEDNLVKEVEMSNKELEMLRETDRLMRRFDYDDITLNLPPRVIPNLKRADKVNIKFFETEHEDIYDVMFEEDIYLEEIDDTFKIDFCARILNYGSE